MDALPMNPQPADECRNLCRSQGSGIRDPGSGIQNRSIDSSTHQSIDPCIHGSMYSGIQGSKAPEIQGSGGPSIHRSIAPGIQAHPPNTLICQSQARWRGLPSGSWILKIEGEGRNPWWDSSSGIVFLLSLSVGGSEDANMGKRLNKVT